MTFQMTIVRRKAEAAASILGPFLWKEYCQELASTSKRFRDDRVLTGYELSLLQAEVSSVLFLIDSDWSAENLTSHSDSSIDNLEQDAMIEFTSRLKHLTKSKVDKYSEDQGLANYLRSQVKQLLAAVPMRPDFDFGPHLGPLREPKIDWYLARRVLEPSGAAVSRGSGPSAWIDARRRGVTATDANRLIKLSGDRRSSWAEVLASKTPGYTEPYFQSYDLGLEREPIIAKWVAEQFQDEEFIENDFLFRGEDPQHLATPDLIGKYAIGEIKVSTKPLSACLTRYRDQLQWQLHVLMADQVLFVVENRFSQERELTWVERDEERIGLLAEAADSLLEELQ